MNSKRNLSSVVNHYCKTYDISFGYIFRKLNQEFNIDKDIDESIMCDTIDLLMEILEKKGFIRKKD